MEKSRRKNRGTGATGPVKYPVITVELTDDYDKWRKTHSWFFEACHGVYRAWFAKDPKLSFREIGPGNISGICGQFRYANDHILAVCFGYSTVYGGRSGWSKDCMTLAGNASYGANYPGPPFMSIRDYGGSGREISADRLIDFHLRANLKQYFESRARWKSNEMGIEFKDDEVLTIGGIGRPI